MSEKDDPWCTKDGNGVCSKYECNGPHFVKVEHNLGTSDEVYYSETCGGLIWLIETKEVQKWWTI